MMEYSFGEGRNQIKILIATSRGVIKVMSFRRRTEEQRWNKEEFDKIQGIPW